MDSPPLQLTIVFRLLDSLLSAVSPCLRNSTIICFTGSDSVELAMAP
jgi:hypothetical protein